ncbi:GGDEF domain-containing protein [Nakamurella silvestris]|nr:GGDEF domain-containing protein [Nakamurella silvestris]
MVRGSQVPGAKVRSIRTTDVHPRTLRMRWWERTAVSGWSFPSDWPDPAVDAVCEAIADGGDVRAGAERLGAARAAAGVSLGETLADVDALIALGADQHAEVLRRAVSLGWADRAVAPRSEVSDPLTGLSSADYLKVRLGELYRGAEVGRGSLDDTHALVVVRMDLSGREVWQRALPMILVGDALRTVFDGGQTLARVGGSSAVAVAERSAHLSRRVRLVANLIDVQLAADPEISARSPRVWVESLPPGYGAALDLVGELGR